MTRLLSPACLLLLPTLAPAGAPSFTKEIAPLLKDRCLSCHAGPRPRGDLRLTTRAALFEGGATGPAVKPGKPGESLLFTHTRDRKMPPRRPLSVAEVDLLRRWIEAGAPWEGPALQAPRAATPGRAGPDWWSLQPIRRPPLPAVKNTSWGRDPLDAFVLAALEARGLAPSPEADRRTYIRRVTVDLTGLLPTPEETDAFLADTRPNAHERLVDRLLASPAHGERFARHWLDVVRFAESHGYEMNTLRPSAWPYRDYVIRAMNEDRPYPRFVREQLAGDVAGAADLTRAATGFLVGGAHDLVGNATEEGKRQQRADDLADVVATTASTFLGLTVGCARCHDHKFDPIAQREFYALQALFAGVEHAERDLGPADPERLRQARQLRLALADLDAKLDTREPLAGSGKRPPVSPLRNVERFAAVSANFLRFDVQATNDGSEPCIDEMEVYGPGGPVNLALASRGTKPTASSVYPGSSLHRLEHLNDGRHGNGRSWISAERGKGWVRLEFPQAVRIDRVVWGRDREGVYKDRLAVRYRVEVSSDGKAWQTVATSADRLPPGTPGGTNSNTESVRLLKRIAELEKPRKVYAGTFRKPDVTYLLKRGDVMQCGDVVERGVPAAIRPAFTLPAGASEREGRRALAAWLTHPDNPLPARVLVNRVWGWHLGQGLLRTPSDLGFNGERPSHPDLLDFLASEFRTSGWSLKKLHRRIVLSATYRQSSAWNERAAALDAGNRLLWRVAPRRLEAEVIRDAMLQVSGALDRAMGGPGYHLWDYSGYVIVFKLKDRLPADAYRRMIYQFKPRLQQDGTFGAFDCPDATASVPRRTSSTTALQALNLLNDPFVLDQAERFAARVRREAGGEVGAQVERAFRLALGRAPAPCEARAAQGVVRAHGLAPLCRALLNANEFVFVR
jgi:hypothetical protein